MAFLPQSVCELRPCLRIVEIKRLQDALCQLSRKCTCYCTRATTRENSRRRHVYDPLGIDIPPADYLWRFLFLSILNAKMVFTNEIKYRLKVMMVSSDMVYNSSVRLYRFICRILFLLYFYTNPKYRRLKQCERSLSVLYSKKPKLEVVEDNRLLSLIKSAYSVAGFSEILSFVRVKYKQIRTSLIGGGLKMSISFNAIVVNCLIKKEISVLYCYLNKVKQNIILLALGVTELVFSVVVYVCDNIANDVNNNNENSRNNNNSHQHVNSVRKCGNNGVINNNGRNSYCGRWWVLAVFVLVLQVDGCSAAFGSDGVYNITAPATVNHITASPRGVVRLAVIAPEEDSSNEQALRQVLPSVELAVRNVIDPVNGLLPGWEFQVQHRDSMCSSTHGPLAAFELHNTSGIAII